MLLVQRHGELVTRDDLHSQLWPGDSFGDFDHGLNNAVNRLREALGDSAASQRYIQTAPRRGYRFIAEIEPVVSASADGKSTSKHVGEERAQDPIASPANGITSIAVRPLENSSGDGSQDYFAEIVTEALISELARIQHLRVFPCSIISMQKDDDRTSSADEVHRDLLVEGTVVRRANQVRVNVRVLRMPARTQVWSQTYDRDLGEILAVQKEVAATIAAQVRGHPTPLEKLHFSSAKSIEPAAYDCYLRGRFYAQHQNKADNEAAMVAFEQAIDIDPGFAMAHAELAQTYVWKLFLFAPHERQWQEKAFVSVAKALSLDPHLAVAYLARGRLLWTPVNHFPHVRAIRDYRRAVWLNPNLDEARNQLALIYCHIGYFEDALRESQAAALTNPNNHLAVYRTAQTMVFQGKHEAALAVLRTIPRDVNPSLIGYQTAWVLFNLKRRDEASSLIAQLLLDHPEDDGALFISMQAVFAAAAGDRPLAAAKIEASIRTGKGFGHFHHAAYHIAIAYALLKESEQAVHWLDFAAMDGFPCYPLFEDDLNLTNIRDDARFVEFMTKLKHQWLDFQVTVEDV